MSSSSDEKKINNTNHNVKDISKKEIAYNDKKTKKLFIFMYLIPLVLLIVIGIIYIPLHNNLLLIPFAILMFIVLFGHDGFIRTCPHCKKWNSVVFIENKNIIKKSKKTSKNLFGKQTVKEVKERKRKFKGECQNCYFTIETERKRLF